MEAQTPTDDPRRNMGKKKRQAQPLEVTAPLRPVNAMRSTDLRKTLGVAAATMHAILQKSTRNAAANATSGGKPADGSRRIHPSIVREILVDRGFAYPTLAVVIAVMVCKGGTGKSTTTFFVAFRLAAYGARVLVIDADPQGSLTVAFKLDEYGYAITPETTILSDVFEEDCALEKAIIKVTDNLHLIPSTSRNAWLDNAIDRKCVNTREAISEKIEAIRSKYDYILIDCAPAINRTNAAAAGAADLIILPVNLDAFSEWSLGQTVTEIGRVRGKMPKVALRAVITRYDEREHSSMKYIAAIAETEGQELFETMIKNSTDLKNSITENKDLFENNRSTVKNDYDSLTKEIMGLNEVNLRKKKPTQKGRP